MRGFAVVSTDTGHKSHGGPFDFNFAKDQQAYLDFAYLANAQVAAVAKQLIARHYGKAAAFSYFVGCSTGGREGMILSQRYPMAFNGIISGAPAMRTGFSNLAIGKWIPVAFNQIAPKDANGKPVIAQAITDSDRKLIMDALMKRCDAKDGVADGMISDPLACDFDPAALACSEGRSDGCLPPAKAAAIKKAFGGPKTPQGLQVYPAFLYDAGIAAPGPIRGILAPGPGIFGPATTAMEVDVSRGSSRRRPAARGLDIHQPHHLLRQRREADLLPRRQRSLVFGARYAPLLHGNGGCEWRAGGRIELEPILLRPGHGTLRRRSRTGSVRPARRNGRLGGEGNGARPGHRHREGLPGSQSAPLRCSEARPVQRSGRPARRRRTSSAAEPAPSLSLIDANAVIRKPEVRAKSGRRHMAGHAIARDRP